MKKSFLKNLLLAVTTTFILTSCGGSGQGTDNTTTADANTTKAEVAENTTAANTTVKASSDNPAVSREDSANTIVIGEYENQGVYSPTYYISAYDKHVINMIYESLLNSDEKGMLVQSRLVDNYKISDDGSEITFKLKDGIKFSDGTPLTAEDIEFTYLVIADPSYAGRFGSAVKNIKGYPEYSAEGSTMEKLEGIQVVDPLTIKFSFIDGNRSNLADCSTEIMSKAFYPDFVKGKTAETVEAKKSEPMGSGPYKLDVFEPGQFTRLVKNENYWDKSVDLKVDNIVVKFVEKSTEMDEIIKGDIDILSGVIELEKVDRAKNEGADFISLEQYGRSGYGYMNFNCESEITKDVKIRQAVAYAFDGASFIESQYGDLATRIYIPMTKTNWAYSDALESKLTQYTLQPDKANALLDEAGWTKGADGIREKDGKKLVLRFKGMTENPVIEALIPVLTDNLKAVGITLETTYTEFNSLMDTVRTSATSGEWEMYFMASSWPTADPDTLYNNYTTENIGDGKDNTPRYSNPKVDELLDKGRKEIDIQKAIPIYEDIAVELNRDMPTIMVYTNTYTDLVNKRLGGFDKLSTFYDWSMIIRDGGSSIK